MRLRHLAKKYLPSRVRYGLLGVEGWLQMSLLTRRGRRISRMYTHEAVGCVRPGEFGFKTDVADPELPAIAGRLVRYFQHQRDEFSRLGVAKANDVWTLHVADHAAFATALEEHNIELVAATLLTICQSPLVAGFMNYVPYERLLYIKGCRQAEAKHCLDKLLSLSEALGCSPVQCPEQGDWGCDIANPQQLLHAVATRLPFPIDPPRAGGGTFGMVTPSGIVCMRDLTAMYVAYRICQVLRGSPRKTVAEIGGGTGTLAYYLAKAQLEQVAIYDLPTVSVVQAYYLIRSLGYNQVWLHGEPENGAAVRLLPYWQLEQAPVDHYHLVINHDSLPEIELGVAQRYLQVLCEKRVDLFLSFNQEAHAADRSGSRQSIVKQLVQENGGMEPLYRFPYWMRPGYVEELYRVRQRPDRGALTLHSTPNVQ